MLDNIINYFTNLNTTGQALFIVGVLLVITFIILLIIVLKPDKNKIKKVYSENSKIDSENTFEAKLKDINNICDKDINIENDRTRNLKNIVDQLKDLEAKSNGKMNEIKKYEMEQENTAIISVQELLNNLPKDDFEMFDVEEQTSAKPEPVVEPPRPVQVEEPKVYNKEYNNVNEYRNIVREENIPQQYRTVGVENRVQQQNVNKNPTNIPEPQYNVSQNNANEQYRPKQEVFSPIYRDRANMEEHNGNNDANANNEQFLNSLKEFRNNL